MPTLPAEAPPILYKYVTPDELSILRDRRILAEQPLVFMRAGELMAVAVLSLSATRTSLLMWEQYADAHAGLAIGFDRAQDILPYPESNRRLFRPDSYATDRPRKATGHQLSDEEVLLRKGTEWSYEHEWRLNLRWPSADDEPMDYSENRLYPIRTESVSEVILGCRSALQNEVIDLLRQPDYAHVRLFRAVPNSRHDRLNIEELPRVQW